MKRFLILVIALGLIAGSVATAEAGRKAKKPNRDERTVTGSYKTQFVPYGSLVYGPCTHPDANACVRIQTEAGESSFTAKVSDAHGQPVMVTVTSPGSNTEWFEYGTFCGETKEPISFDPGVDLVFHIGYWDPYLPTELPNCPPGLGTTGTVSVTLSDRP